MLTSEIAYVQVTPAANGFIIEVQKVAKGPSDKYIAQNKYRLLEILTDLPWEASIDVTPAEEKRD